MARKPSTARRTTYQPLLPPLPAGPLPTGPAGEPGQPRTCAQACTLCGQPTGPEPIMVANQIWCNPCADQLAKPPSLPTGPEGSIGLECPGAVGGPLPKGHLELADALAQLVEAILALRTRVFRGEFDAK
jgi:hypothetical protein